MSKQLSRIAAKFGGLRPFSAAVGRDYSNVYRWQRSHGMIPVSAVEDVQSAAAREGIVLTAEDWEP